MKAWLLVVAGFLLLNGCSANFKVEYSCDTMNNLTFSAWGETTAVKTVHAENMGGTCGTAADASKTKFTLNGGISTDKTEGIVAANAATATNCGYSARGTQRTIVLILSTTNFVTTSSGKTTIICDTATPDTAVKAAPVSNITGAPAGTTTTIITGDPSLVVVLDTVTTGANLAAATTPNNVEMGDDIKIVTVVDISGTANTALLSECKARPGAGLNPELAIINTAGCSDQSNSVFSTDVAPTKDTSVNNKYIAISPVFKAFKTANAASLYIQCNVLVCISGDSSCNIPTCASGGRRRRSTKTRTLGNGTLSASVFIVTSKGQHDFSNGIHDDNTPTISSCLSHVSFISVVAILAVLLVVSLAVSVFFCSKLIRQNNNNQQKEAYPNPAYKA